MDTRRKKIGHWEKKSGNWEKMSEDIENKEGGLRLAKNHKIGAS